MLNEYVYCPRLAYLEWVQGEFAQSADTVEGQILHHRVDRRSGGLPAASAEEPIIHATSVSLSSPELAITAKLDLVIGQGNTVQPVDYKRGKRPHVPVGAYDPERVQLCAQGLLLRAHGYNCDSGIIYYSGSRERVIVAFDEALITLTHQSITGARGMKDDSIPPPLNDSPKCPRCSLVGICLPDEIRFLSQEGIPPRPLYTALERALPLYVQSPHAYVRKDGDNLVIEVDRQKIAEVHLNDTSQIALFGAATLSTPLLQECFRRGIPVTWLSYGGWFMGHTIGTGHHNIETRLCQFQAASDPERCLTLARGWIAAKIANCRTLLRRNWRDEDEEGPIVSGGEEARKDGEERPDEKGGNGPGAVRPLGREGRK